jgi:type IV secretory pathway ATPase VirB11/archaellum biosynthesis ATPase
LKAPPEGTQARLWLWGLASVIAYLIAETLALAALGVPRLPLAVLVGDYLGLGSVGALAVLASAMTLAVGAEGLVLSSTKRGAPPSAPARPVERGIESRAINDLLGGGSQNFVEVFPLKTGVINVYGAIAKAEGAEGYRYVVIEPELTEAERRQFAELKELLIEEMDVDLRSIETREKAEAFLTGKVADMAREYGYRIPLPSLRKLQYYFARDFIHLGKIEPMMQDPLIEDISCDGARVPIYVWHRDYESIPTNVSFGTDQELDTFVSKLAYVSGKHISLAQPMVDASLQDGSRLHLTYGKEITQRGSTFTIRKFKADPFTVVDLIKYNTVNPEVAAYLWYLVEKRLALLVAGSTASGKTTTLNCLATFITPGQKVISIEDSVTGDAEILVSEGGAVRRVKIGPYVDSALSRGSVRTPLGHELARPEGVRVLTASDEGRVFWGACTALIRHRVRKEFVKVTTAGGRSIEVTADHSLFTLGEGGGLEGMSGGEISVGTLLAAPRALGGREGAPREWEDPHGAAEEAGGAGGGVSLVLRRRADEEGAPGPALGDLCFDRVVTVERGFREEEVYDLSVPATGRFVANGLLCHNTPELNLPQENWIQEVSRAEGSAGEITQFDLVRNALRQRPDVIIVGEIRGKEAFTLFQAVSTGHGGMSTVHADSVEAVFNRLTTEPINLPRSLVGTSLDCIVLQLKIRLGDRSVRRVVSVSEILGYDSRSSEVVMNEVYRWDPVADRLVATGRSRLVEKINQRYGLRADEIKRDLELRKVFLEWLASKNYRSYKEVSQYVQEFYANPYAMASRARTELEAAAQ